MSDPLLASRPDLCRPGAPTSLTLGQCGEENRRQIGQFSKRDAARYGEYEEQLGQLVGAVDALLDHAAADPAEFAEAGLLGKVRWLRANWHLVTAGRTLSPVTAAFYELMTAPTTKVTLFSSSCSRLDPGQVVRVGAAEGDAGDGLMHRGDDLALHPRLGLRASPPRDGRAGGRARRLGLPRGRHGRRVRRHRQVGPGGGR